jgi:RNA polymerase sigma-70 factor (ECF subfamily)
MTTTPSLEIRTGGNTTWLYRSYRGQVARWALRLTHSPADAEDVTQEVFLVAHRRLSGATELRNPSLWLFRVTRNIARHLWRDRRRRGSIQLEQVTELPDDGPGPFEALEHRVELSRLEQALGSLCEQDQRLVYLCDVRRLPAARVTDLTGINAQTVRVRRYRARRRIAGWLHEAAGGVGGRLLTHQR